VNKSRISFEFSPPGFEASQTNPTNFNIYGDVMMPPCLSASTLQPREHWLGFAKHQGFIFPNTNLREEFATDFPLEEWRDYRNSL